MTGAVLSGAIAAVDFDATKADVRRAVEDFLTQLFAKAPDTDVTVPPAMPRLAAAIAGALLLLSLQGRSFATMRCNASCLRPAASSLRTRRLSSSTICRAWMTPP
jgi:hypothetical protein